MERNLLLKCCIGLLLASCCLRCSSEGGSDFHLALGGRVSPHEEDERARHSVATSARLDSAAGIARRRASEQASHRQLNGRHLRDYWSARTSKTLYMSRGSNSDQLHDDSVTDNGDSTTLRNILTDGIVALSDGQPSGRPVSGGTKFCY
jgi:hypothetical protein